MLDATIRYFIEIKQYDAQVFNNLGCNGFNTNIAFKTQAYNLEFTHNLFQICIKYRFFK